MLVWAGAYLKKVCLAPVIGVARAKPREDMACWKVAKQHLLLINQCLSGSPRAILRPPKWRDLSQVRLCLCSQIKQSVIPVCHSKCSRCHQGLQIHTLLFSVVLKPVLLIFVVLLPKLAGICLRKTVLGAAQSNLATFYARRIIAWYLSSLCQQSETDDTQMFKRFWEVVCVVIPLCTETCSVQLMWAIPTSARGVGVAEAGLLNCSLLEICFGSLLSFHGMRFLEIPQTDRYHKRWGGPDTWCAGTAILLRKRKTIWVRHYNGVTQVAGDYTPSNPCPVQNIYLFSVRSCE